MYKLKIFSYVPNPRVWKAVIAGKICGVEVEVIGDKPANLGSWLWDFNPKILNENEKNPDHKYARKGKRGFSGVLYKTDSFLKAHPFGTVPAAFSPDGDIGIFESNSILRAVARVGKEFNVDYNPFIIYGNVGIGKTHLLNAIAWNMQKINKKKLLTLLLELSIC